MGAPTLAESPSAMAARRPPAPPVLRRLGRADYVPVWQAMQAFTAGRSADTPDELWLVEHNPVFTLGQAGKPEHVLADIGVPLVKIDRGGQVTYHGPGQAVIYLLLDLTRRKLRVRELVSRIEQAVIDLLAEHGVAAARRDGAPGVYACRDGSGPKVAALGLRVKNGCCYHGVSLNVDLDLSPFAAINPCGYPGLAVTRTIDLGIPLSLAEMQDALARHLTLQLEKQP